MSTSPNNSKAFLLIGACGSGKTWVMKSLIKTFKPKVKGRYNTIHFLTDEKVCILGKYVGEVFDGSDKLSMAVSKDFQGFKRVADKNNWIVIAEGDRFTNKNFLKTFSPSVLKITDNGEAGRKKRGSKQTERHLKAISTRVSNIDEDFTVKTSNGALEKLLELIHENI